MSTLNERIKLAEQDADVLEDLAEWLRSYVFEVDACGGNGVVARAKIQGLARQCLKALVNYI